MNFWFGRLSVVFMVGAGDGQWSVSNLVDGLWLVAGRWSVFIFENGQLPVS